MRKTGLYGKSTSGPYIEWPTASDLLQMVKNIPNKIKDLKHKKSTNPDYFGAFQVILSNGMSSPVFTVSGTNDQDMQSCNIPDFSLVKKVNGTKQGEFLRCLLFSKNDGTQIAKVEMEAG